MPDATSINRARSTWQVHRWEHPDGRYFELASNVLSAEEIERRGLPAAAKDYKFHSSTPMVPAAVIAGVLDSINDGEILARARAVAEETFRTSVRVEEDDETVSEVISDDVAELIADEVLGVVIAALEGSADA